MATIERSAANRCSWDSLFQKDRQSCTHDSGSDKHYVVLTRRDLGWGPHVIHSYCSLWQRNVDTRELNSRSEQPCPETYNPTISRCSGAAPATQAGTTSPIVANECDACGLQGIEQINHSLLSEVEYRKRVSMA